jgi:glutaconate CoA-transferase subunit B
VWRRGTAQALVTGKCVFRFDARRARFSLASVHPGETAESVCMATGFDFDGEPNVPTTPDPDAAALDLLRGPVCDEMAETYPEFCRRVWGRTAAAERAC